MFYQGKKCARVTQQNCSPHPSSRMVTRLLKHRSQYYFRVTSYCKAVELMQQFLLLLLKIMFSLNYSNHSVAMLHHFFGCATRAEFNIFDVLVINDHLLKNIFSSVASNLKCFSISIIYKCHIKFENVFQFQ